MKRRIISAAAVLVAAALFTGCPGPGIEPPAEEVFTPKKIVLFGTDKLYDGNLGGRTGADAKVTDDVNKPAGLRDVHAFISVDGADCIKNMPERFGFSRDLPVVGPDGATLIADNWDDLLDGEIKAHLIAAGVWTNLKGEAWWSGSNPDGTVSGYNCKGFTSASGDVLGSVGGVIEKAQQWLSYHYGTEKPEEYQGHGSWPMALLGFGLSAETVGEYIPVKSIKIDRESLVMKTGETAVLTATVDPPNATRNIISWHVDRSPADVEVSGGIVKALTTGSGCSVVASVFSPEGDFEVKVPVTVTPSRIVMFSTSKAYSADSDEDRVFHGSNDLYDLIANDSSRPEGFKQSRPFAGFDGIGPKDFPARYADFGFKDDVPVTGPGPEYKEIAENWADFLDGTIKMSLADAGLGYDSYWWSGCRDDGSLWEGNNAADWTNSTGSALVGAMNDTADIFERGPHNLTGMGELPFLGIAW